MNYAIAYIQKNKEPITPQNVHSHQVQVLKDINEETYHELSNWNREVINFDRKKNAARILLKKGEAFVFNLQDIEQQIDNNEHMNSDQVEFQTIESLSDLANAFHSFWRTSEAAIKRSFGRDSNELREFYLLRATVSPFGGIFDAIRNITNHQ